MPKRASRRKRYERGNAAKLINQLKVIPGELYVVAARVSTGPQENNGNLKDQISFLSKYVRERSGVIVDTFEMATSGWYPEWIFDAVQIAKKHGAKILAESTDRFVRHPHYHSNRRPDLQATELNLQELADWTEGISLLTYLHPNATPWEVRSHQRRRGQLEKNSFGGNLSKCKKSPDPEAQRKLDQLAVWELYKRLPPGGPASSL